MDFVRPWIRWVGTGAVEHAVRRDGAIEHPSGLHLTFGSDGHALTKERDQEAWSKSNFIPFSDREYASSIVHP